MNTDAFLPFAAIFAVELLRSVVALIGGLT